MRLMDDRSGPPEPAEALRQRLIAFHPQFHSRLLPLMAQSPLVADLAESFPALLFALATGHGTRRQRQDAICAVLQGTPLRAAADALGLPLWLRRIAPEALVCPLPHLPDDAILLATLANHIPSSAEACVAWLDRVASASRLAGRDFALWVAREKRCLPPIMADDDYQWLLAWGWASLHAPDDFLLRRRWTPALGWKRARDEITIWKKRIGLVGALATFTDPWFENGQALGFDIVRLETPDAWVAESVAMDNCLDQYANHIAYGRIRVFSVRRNGRPVANVEITLRHDEATMPCISQVRGPRNRRASPVVWQAVHAWMGAQSFRSLFAAETSEPAAKAALATFWMPYLAAVRAAKLPVRRLPMRIATVPRTRMPRGARNGAEKAQQILRSASA